MCIHTYMRVKRIAEEMNALLELTNRHAITKENIKDY